MKACDVAIIGAGPYGLSIAAHLRARSVVVRIFGRPMHTWLAHMPEGMRLKSEGFASCLSDPDSEGTLKAYCKGKGLPYADTGLPVPLETFAAYGMEFQKKFVPELENKLVVSLQRTVAGYRLRLDDEETVLARKVIVAVGLNYYDYVPEILSGLPGTHLSHSSEHSTLERFKDCQVAVLGAGSSALDLAALLHRAKADVQVVARTPAIRFYDPPSPNVPSFLEQLRNPQTGIGQGWRLFWCANAPLMFRQMPVRFRLDKVKGLLGPGPGWFIKQEVIGKVPLHLGLSITGAEARNGTVRLQLADGAGAVRTIEAGHVIAATGYRVDVRRLDFIDSNILEQIRLVENTPVLSSNFECSSPGLYFVGASAANTFGPLLRFAFGTGFTAHRLAKHLARQTVRKRKWRSRSNTSPQSSQAGQDVSSHSRTGDPPIRVTQRKDSGKRNCTG